jgi:lipid-binding SYLF domain-containing protein
MRVTGLRSNAAKRGTTAMLRTLILGYLCLAWVLVGSGSAVRAEGLLERARKGISDAAQSVGEAIETHAAPLTAAEIGARTDAALTKLYAESSEARALGEMAVAVLVFPRITKGGLIVGGQYGEGAMLQGGRTTGHYSIVGASYGLQIGAQVFSFAMFFLNDAGLAHFQANKGWEAGVGPTLVGGDRGWSASMGTNDLQGDIVPVFFGQAGLMAGGGLQGTKITQIER